MKDGINTAILARALVETISEKFDMKISYLDKDNIEWKTVDSEWVGEPKANELP